MPPNTERDRCTAAFFAFGGGVRAMAASPLQDTALEILPDISRDIDRPLQTHSHCIMWERQPSVSQCKHFPAGNQLSFLPVNHDANLNYSQSYRLLGDERDVIHWNHV
jgi:hypothetical protein